MEFPKLDHQIEIVISKLHGGLGNQLFQVAAGLYCSSLFDSQLLLDTSPFLFKEKRDLAFGDSNIIEASYLINKLGILNWIQIFFTGKIRLPFALVRQNILNNSDGIVFSKNNILYLDGYWQNKKYYMSCESLFLSFFRCLCEKRAIISQIVDEEGTVGVHVRRGDYLQYPYNKIYSKLDVDYYLRSLEYIRSFYGIDKVFIFSDDITWCKENLCSSVFSSAIYIENSAPLEDLVAISACEHFILSNSTFSWWGRALSREKGITVFPKNWFIESKRNDYILNSLFFENWKIL